MVDWQHVGQGSSRWIRSQFGTWNHLVRQSHIKFRKWCRDPIYEEFWVWNRFQELRTHWRPVCRTWSSPCSCSTSFSKWEFWPWSSRSDSWAFSTCLQASLQLLNILRTSGFFSRLESDKFSTWRGGITGRGPGFGWSEGERKKGGLGFGHEWPLEVCGLWKKKS